MIDYETCNFCDFNSITYKAMEIRNTYLKVHWLCIAFCVSRTLIKLGSFIFLFYFFVGISHFQNKSFFFKSEYLDIRRMFSS